MTVQGKKAKLSTPDLVLEGHTDNAQFALGCSMAEPLVASGGQDTNVRHPPPCPSSLKFRNAIPKLSLQRTIDPILLQGRGGCTSACWGWGRGDTVRGFLQAG